MRRHIALSLLLCFVIASLLATSFIIVQADHDCIGENCSVCVQIHKAQKMLERMGNAIITLIVAVGLFITTTTRTKLAFFRGHPSNLVIAKVRMNN